MKSICLLLLYVIYLLIGAKVFQILEQPAEVGLIDSQKYVYRRNQLDQLSFIFHDWYPPISDS